MIRHKNEQLQYRHGEPLKLFEVSVVWTPDQIGSAGSVERLVLVAWNQEQALHVAKTIGSVNDPTFLRRRLKARSIGFAASEVQACDVLAVQTMGTA